MKTLKSGYDWENLRRNDGKNCVKLSNTSSEIRDITLNVKQYCAKELIIKGLLDLYNDILDKINDSLISRVFEYSVNIAGLNSICVTF